MSLLFEVLASLRPRPHYAGIWKRSFISPVKPSVHTNPEKLSTENGAFRKRSWKRRNLKTELFVLVWKECILKTELFENDDITTIRWFVCPSLPQTQIINGGRNSDCHVDFATWVQPESRPQSLRSFWPAAGIERLWEQPFWACAIDEDWVKPDGQNSVISLVISKWLLPEPLDSCRRPEGS